jgi:hypothetical protein
VTVTCHISEAFSATHNRPAEEWIPTVLNSKPGLRKERQLVNQQQDSSQSRERVIRVRSRQCPARVKQMSSYAVEEQPANNHGAEAQAKV